MRHCSNDWFLNDKQSLQWRHNGRDGVLNHQPPDCLLNRVFKRRSKKKPKLRVIGLCVGNSPVTCEFLAQMASNAENVSIWWRHHGGGLVYALRSRTGGHWNPVTHIRVSELNQVMACRCQTIAWSNVDLLSIGPVGMMHFKVSFATDITARSERTNITRVGPSPGHHGYFHRPHSHQEPSNL